MNTLDKYQRNYEITANTFAKFQPEFDELYAARQRALELGGDAERVVRGEWHESWMTLAAKRRAIEDKIAALPTPSQQLNDYQLGANRSRAVQAQRDCIDLREQLRQVRLRLQEIIVQHGGDITVTEKEVLAKAEEMQSIYRFPWNTVKDFISTHLEADQQRLNERINDTWVRFNAGREALERVLLAAFETPNAETFRDLVIAEETVVRQLQRDTQELHEQFTVAEQELLDETMNEIKERFLSIARSSSEYPGEAEQACLDDAFSILGTAQDTYAVNDKWTNAENLLLLRRNLAALNDLERPSDEDSDTSEE